VSVFGLDARSQVRSEGEAAGAAMVTGVGGTS